MRGKPDCKLFLLQQLSARCFVEIHGLHSFHFGGFESLRVLRMDSGQALRCVLPPAGKLKGWVPFQLFKLNPESLC